MRRAWPMAKWLVAPTIALIVALVVAPDRAELALHTWLLVVLGIAFVALLRIVHAAYPAGNSPFRASLGPSTTRTERPASLARTEREISMAGAAAFDVHFRLRPMLVELAGELLASRRGIDLERETERAHAVLGDEAWELVRPDRPQPSQRHGAGISPAELDRIVTALEHV